MQTTDSGRVRAHNSSMVLKQIWSDREISRADIARHLGFSRSTVSAIVNNLMSTGLLSTLGTGISNGGRRPILLGFNDDAFGIVGVEMGASHVCVALTDLRGRVEVWHHDYFDVRTDPHGAISLTQELIDDSLRSSKRTLSEIVGIGLGVPSPVHRDNPGRLSPQILPAWAGIDLVEALQTAFELPVYMENDANLGALAERWWGEGTDGGDLAYIKLATGIGSGHIINGAIYRGSKGFAGEIGHTTIEPNDTRFNYGMRGSLTSLVGTEALLERAQALRTRWPDTTLATDPTLADVIEACLNGDPLAVSLVEEAGVYIGYALANMLNILNPATVVLGGALTKVGDCLLHPLRQTVRERTLWGSIGQCRVVTSSLTSQAIAVGAATLVLEAALRDPRIFPISEAARISGV
jgi:predicted NBD/HSP70 family sugar kinase